MRGIFVVVATFAECHCVRATIWCRYPFFCQRQFPGIPQIPNNLRMFRGRRGGTDAVNFAPSRPSYQRLHASDGANRESTQNTELKPQQHETRRDRPAAPGWMQNASAAAVPRRPDQSADRRALSDGLSRRWETAAGRFADGRLVACRGGLEEWVSIGIQIWL